MCRFDRWGQHLLSVRASSQKTGGGWWKGKARSNSWTSTSWACLSFFRSPGRTKRAYQNPERKRRVLTRKESYRDPKSITHENVSWRGEKVAVWASFDGNCIDPLARTRWTRKLTRYSDILSDISRCIRYSCHIRYQVICNMKWWAPRHPLEPICTQEQEFEFSYHFTLS